MTVRELIDILKEEDPYATVILARDEEGNGFNTLSDVAEGMWCSDTKELIDPDDVDGEETDVDAAVVLWP